MPEQSRKRRLPVGILRLKGGSVLTREPSLPNGVVLTATGKIHYHVLAAHAARAVKRHNPGLPVDLLADRPPEEPHPFDGVTVDSGLSRHTKVDALLRSRFDRTLYLDSDVLVLAPIMDVFEVLERFDVAMVHDQFLANIYTTITYRKDLPTAFPHMNGGVMAVKSSPVTRAFLEEWKVAIADHGIDRDQPSLRELLWDSDLRIATLPPEYNMMNFDILRAKPLDDFHIAPRIMHNPHFYQFWSDFRDSPDMATDALGPSRAARLKTLLENDRTLHPERLGAPRASRGLRTRRWVANLAWIAARSPRAIRFGAGYHSKRFRGFLRRLGN